MEVKRQKVYEELIATERQYLLDMKMTQELFLEPVRDRGLLNKDEVASLFSNLTALIPLNQDLLSVSTIILVSFILYSLLLGKKLDTNVDVGTAFTDMIRHMKVYSIYCSSINNIKERIDGFSASYPKFRQYLETCARNPICREMLLPDFLIMPLQRICKYPLLLKSLLECTPTDHPDHVPLTSALNEMRQLIDMVNNRTGIVENIRRLKKLESLIDNSKQLNLIKSNRLIIRAGPAYLYKKQTKHKTEICIHLLSDLMLISRVKDSKREVKDILSSQDSSPGASKLIVNKRASRKIEEIKDVLTVIHKIDLFTPPPAIDGSDFSGNLLELVDSDEAENVVALTKMERVLERIEFLSVDDKKSWASDIKKSAKNCFETWKKDYFKTMMEARMSQRSSTDPLAVAISGDSNLPNQAIASSVTSSAHSRSSSMGNIRVNAVVAAMEKFNAANEIKVRKSPRNFHSPVPLAWMSGHVKASRSSTNSEYPPQSDNLSASSIFKSNNSTIPEPPEPPPLSTSPQYLSPSHSPPHVTISAYSPPLSPHSPHSPRSPRSFFTANKQLPSFVSCPDLFTLPSTPTQRSTTYASEQNWEVESEEQSLRDSSRSFVSDESGRNSVTFLSEDSWNDISMIPKLKYTTSSSNLSSNSNSSLQARGKTRSVPRIEPLRNLSDISIRSREEMEFWDGVKVANEKEERKEDNTVMTPRGGSLQRSARRNFAMALAAEYASTNNRPSSSEAPPLPITEVFTVQQHELAKKDEEIAELKRKLENISNAKGLEHEVAKRDETIEELKRKVNEECVRSKLFNEKFHEMQRLYHERNLVQERERNDNTEANNEITRLTQEVQEVKRKFDDEREKRRFYRDKFQDMQKLYHDSLQSVVEFQEKIKSIGAEFNGGSKSGMVDHNKLEQQLAEERARKQFFKDKFQEVQRLYQDSLESMTSYMERSTNVENLYRSTLEEAKISKWKTQELEGLYIETQESVEFFREKILVVEEACRDAMREAEYFKLKAEKLEKSLTEAQRSIGLYTSNLDAMSGMLREAQNEAIHYKQKSLETHALLKEAQQGRVITSDDVKEVDYKGKLDVTDYRARESELEKRVKELEAKVAKMKMKKKSNLRPPSKIIRSPKLGSSNRATERRKNWVRRNSSADATKSEEVEELQISEEEEEQKQEESKEVDFPWLQSGVRSNYIDDNNNNSENKNNHSLPLPEVTASSKNSPPQTKNGNNDLPEEEADDESKRDSRRVAKQRTHKLQQQIQHRLQQKALSEKFMHKNGDVG